MKSEWMRKEECASSCNAVRQEVWQGSTGFQKGRSELARKAALFMLFT